MFVCDRPALLAAVEALVPLVPTGAVASIEADESDGRLTVTVAEAGRGARSSALGRVLLPGSVALPLGPLARALKCGVGHCRCEVASNTSAAVLVLDPDGAARKFTFEVGASPVVPEWPDLPADGCAAVLPSTAFVHLVHAVEFATSARGPFARGWANAAIQFGIEPGRVTAAATDGLTLATATCATETDARQPHRSLLVTPDTVRAWVRSAKQSETVTLTLTERTALFEAGPVSAWSEAVAGLFPQWQQAMPELPHTVTVATERFLAELEAATAVASAKEPRVLFATKPGAVTLTSAGGKARAAMTVPVSGFKGPAVQVPLDAKRLLEIVKAHRDVPALALNYGNDREPIMVSAGAECRCLLAPMIERIEEPQKALRARTGGRA